MGWGGWGGGSVHELCDACAQGSFTSWGMTEVSLCIVFKSPSLADLLLIKQYLVTSSVLKKCVFYWRILKCLYESFMWSLTYVLQSEFSSQWKAGRGQLKCDAFLAGFDLSARCKQQAGLLCSYSCILFERLIDHSCSEYDLWDCINRNLLQWVILVGI